MADFWKEKSYLTEKVGYSIFSFKYFAVLAVIAIIIAVAIIFFKTRNDKQKLILIRVVSMVPLGMEIMKFIVLVSQNMYVPKYYPLGFCSLVAYVFPIYAFAKNEKVRNTARCIICMSMFPAGIVTLIFPNWIGNYRIFAYMALHSDIWHMLMIIFPIWTWLKDREKMRMPEMILGAVIMIALVPFVVMLNKAWDVNYWFLATPSENHPLAAVYNSIGPIGYFAGCVLLALVVGWTFGILQNAIFRKYEKNRNDKSTGQ